MAENEDAAERINALESQLALLAGVTCGLLMECYSRNADLRDRRNSIDTVARVLESLPFVQALPAARKYLHAIDEAREAAEQRQRLGLET
jgi:hypothetical protein